MKSPSTPCFHCGGTGKLNLTKPLTETLSVATIHWQTTNEIFEEVINRYLPDLKITAINNRLTRLLALGFIEVKTEGKAKSWRLK